MAVQSILFSARVAWDCETAKIKAKMKNTYRLQVWTLKQIRLNSLMCKSDCRLVAENTRNPITSPCAATGAAVVHQHWLKAVIWCCNAVKTTFQGKGEGRAG